MTNQNVVKGVRLRAPFTPLTLPPVPRVIRVAWKGPELVSWYALRAVVRRPLVSGTAVALTVATPAVSSRAVLGAALAATATLVGSAESRVRLSTLPALSRAGKRVRRTRRRYRAVMEDAGLTKSGRGDAKRIPRLRRIRATRVGVNLTIDTGSLSMDVETLRKHAGALRSGFRARHVEFGPPGSGTSTVHLIMDDPFRKMIRFHELPRPTRKHHAVVGLDSMGEGVERPLWLPTLLVGAQGSGKSSEAWTILRALQDAGVPHRVRVFDPKGGQEFADLEDCAYQYERDPTRWPRFLEDAFRALFARQAELRAAGRRSNALGPDSPLDIMLIDELLTAMALGANGSKVRVGDDKLSTDQAFMVYLSQARSAGFTVLALTQLAQKATLGPLADLFSNRTVLRVPSDDLVRLVGFDPRVYPAHEIPAVPETAGIGYTQDHLGRVVKYRAAYQTDRERAEIARKMKIESRIYLERTKRHQRGEDKDA